MRTGAWREGQHVFWGEPRKRATPPHGQVLVVESLRARRQAICDMLSRERFGWSALEDEREAVLQLTGGLLARRGRLPELILCNARVAGEAGLRGLARLRVLRPELSVIVFSVFSTPRVREGMARVGGALVFDQHFGLEELRAASLALAHPRRRSG